MLNYLKSKERVSPFLLRLKYFLQYSKLWILMFKFHWAIYPIISKQYVAAQNRRQYWQKSSFLIISLNPHSYIKRNQVVNLNNKTCQIPIIFSLFLNKSHFNLDKHYLLFIIVNVKLWFFAFRNCSIMLLWDILFNHC